MQINFKRVSVFIPLIMLPLGIWLGQRAFRGHSVHEVLDALSGLPKINVILAFVFAAASYGCLTVFDALGVRYAGKRLSYAKTALTSFVSLSLGHNIGVAMVSSGAVRYRLYTGFGLNAADVAKVMLISAVTVGLGLLTLGGFALLLKPDVGRHVVGLAPNVMRGIGILALMAVAAYIGLAWRRRRPFRIRHWELYPPTLRIALAQVGIGTANFVFVSATLHQLMGAVAAYPEVIAAYVLGNVASLVSHVPGGLGVLEFVITSTITHGNVIGALLAFRVIYYFIPLVLGASLLAITEVRRRRAVTRTENGRQIPQQ